MTQSSLQILFLTQTYPRFEGDTSGPFIRDLALGLTRAGDRVTVLVPHVEGLPSEWSDQCVEVRSFRYAPERFELIGYSRSLAADEKMRLGPLLTTPSYLFFAHLAVRRELERRRYDVVQAHWVVPNAIAMLGFSATDVPTAIGLHGSDVFIAEKPGIRWLTARALARAKVLTGCSPELVDRVCRLGFPSARSRVIPYGVDGEVFSPDSGRRIHWRRKLAIPDDARVILGVGRMASKKGFQILIPGLEELLDNPDVHLVLAGGGDRLEEFRRACSHFSASRVHFPGEVLRDTLPDLYRAADIFTLPAVHDRKGNVDGLPNVILEAMATGLPIVATRVSGIPSAVEDGTHGLLVEEGSTEQLVRALRTLLEDHERANEMGLAARQRALRELSWDAVAKRYREAYIDALAGAHPRGVGPDSGH